MPRSVVVALKENQFTCPAIDLEEKVRRGTDPNGVSTRTSS